MAPATVHAPPKKNTTHWLPLLLAALLTPASAADAEAPWGRGKAVAHAYAGL